MFIELHQIQNFVPSNLNRDDTGSPKDCEFGGVRRARISSQCLKRAIRTDPVFAALTETKNGTRTRLLSRLVGKSLVNAGKPQDVADRVAASFARAYAGKMDSKDPKKRACSFT